MSKYTTELRFICETVSGLDMDTYHTPDEVISNARTHIFDFTYPIFDEGYRPVLETKILKRYYTREICAETVGRWKLFLNQRLNEIMPYYNKLYESELLEFNPMTDVNLTIDHNMTTEGEEIGRGTKNAETTGTNNGTINEVGHSETEKDRTEHGTLADVGTNWEYYSDTPQGTVGNLDNLTYLTNATKNTINDLKTHDNTIGETEETDMTNDKTSASEFTQNVEEATTNNRNINNTEDYLEHIIGKRSGVSFSRLLKEFRETFLNIDVMIIDELSDLFFNLW